MNTHYRKRYFPALLMALALSCSVTQLIHAQSLPYFLGSFGSLVSLVPRASASASNFALVRAKDLTSEGLAGFPTNPAAPAYADAPEGLVSFVAGPENYNGIERSYYFATIEDLRAVEFSSRKKEALSAILGSVRFRLPETPLVVTPVLGYQRYFDTSFESRGVLRTSEGERLARTESGPVSSAFVLGAATRLTRLIGVGFSVGIPLHSEYSLRTSFKETRNGHTLTRLINSYRFRITAEPFFSLGFLYGTPHAFKVGASATFGQKIEFEDGVAKQVLNGWAQEPVYVSDFSVFYPAIYRVGFSYRLSNFLTFSGSITSTPWAQLEVENQPLGFTLKIDDSHALTGLSHDGYWYGFGLEVGHTTVARFGLGRVRTPFEDMDGAPVSRWVFGFGFSLPVGMASLEFATNYSMYEFDIIELRKRTYRFKSWGPEFMFGLSLHGRVDNSSVEIVDDFDQLMDTSPAGAGPQLIKILASKGEFALVRLPGNLRVKLGDRVEIVRARRAGEADMVIGSGSVVKLRGQQAVVRCDLFHGFRSIDTKTDFVRVNH